MLLAGLSGIVLIEIYAAVMQRQFQHTDNRIGKGFAILGIYLFVVTYCEYREPLLHFESFRAIADAGFLQMAC